MDLKQLRYLVALADEEHFTRAAKREHVAQPALSRQIQRLEAELGVALVDRTTRRVALTDAGRATVAHARLMLAEADAIVADARDTRALLTGRLTIGVTTTPGPIDVADLLARFHEAHPALELAVREDLSIALLGQLAADRLDVAIVTATAPGLASRPLARDELVLVTHPDHRLAARRQRVPLKALCDEPFICVPDGATIRTQLLAAAAEAGFAPIIRFESGDVRRTCEIVARGLAVAVLPRSEVLQHRDHVAVVRLRADLQHDVRLAWRDGRNLTPAASAFIAELAPDHAGAA